MTADGPTKAVLTLDAPLNWKQAGAVGDAINEALGGNAGVELDRGGKRWTFTRRPAGAPDVLHEAAATAEENEALSGTCDECGAIREEWQEPADQRCPNYGHCPGKLA